jgi:hypothetical protein
MGIGKRKKKHASPDRKREKVDHHKITSMLMVTAVVMIRWSVKGVADCIGMVGAKQESRIILLSGVKNDPLFKTRIMRYH